MTARTVTPTDVVDEQLAEKIQHRARAWLAGEEPAPSPARYAAHAVELIRKAVDENAV